MDSRRGPNVRRTLACMLMVSGAAALASAQPTTPARSLGELVTRVKPGATVWVTDEGGREVSGQLTALSASELALLVDDAERQFKEGQIALVQQRQRDPLWNGALIGAAILGALTSIPLLLLEDAECDPSCGGVVAIYAAIGAGVGLAVDGAVRERRTVYLRPATGASSPGWSVSPAATRTSLGVTVAVRF